MDGLTAFIPPPAYWDIKGLKAEVTNTGALPAVARAQLSSRGLGKVTTPYNSRLPLGTTRIGDDRTSFSPRICYSAKPVVTAVLAC